MANVMQPNNPLLTGGPYLIQPDSNGVGTVLVHNCRPTEHVLERTDFIGHVENVSELELREINPAYINSLRDKVKPAEPLSPEKKSLF